MSTALASQRTLRKEPASHTKAREILGKNFHGLAEVQCHLGRFTDDQRQERLLLRVRNHLTGEFLSEDETLHLLDLCKETHVMCAIHPISLYNLFLEKNAHFWHGFREPWWFIANLEDWVKSAAPDPWILVPKYGLRDLGTSHTVAWENSPAGIEWQWTRKEHCHERPITPVEDIQCRIVHLFEHGTYLNAPNLIRYCCDIEGRPIRLRWHHQYFFLDYEGMEPWGEYHCCTLGVRTS